MACPMRTTRQALMHVEDETGLGREQGCERHEPCKSTSGLRETGPARLPELVLNETCNTLQDGLGAAIEELETRDS